jgi:hypothetical protein
LTIRLKPSFSVSLPEIYEQPDGLLLQSEIGQQLLAVDRHEPFHRFDFDQKTVIDNEVGPEGCLEVNAIKLRADQLLGRDAVSQGLKPPREKRFIDRLKQAGA